jgi:hypothetical protein
VGKDQRAQAFLGQLDSHPEVGASIDCTSYYELESMGKRLTLNPKPKSLTLKLR